MARSTTRKRKRSSVHPLRKSSKHNPGKRHRSSRYKRKRSRSKRTRAVGWPFSRKKKRNFEDGESIKYDKNKEQKEAEEEILRQMGLEQVKSSQQKAAEAAEAARAEKNAERKIVRAENYKKKKEQEKKLREAIRKLRNEEISNNYHDERMRRLAVNNELLKLSSHRSSRPTVPGIQ